MAKFNSDVVFVSIKNLRKAGIRTFLTLIGVIIGIAAIVSLLSIGEGLNVAVEKQFETLGSNIIFVIPGSMSSTVGARMKLTDSDISLMESVPNVTKAVPIYTGNAIMEFNNQKISVQINATDPTKASIFDNTKYFEVQEGREFSRNDTSAILIGAKVSTDLFDKTLGVKKLVKLNGEEFRVIGILKNQNQSFGGGPNTGNTIYMSLDALKRIQSNPQASLVFVQTSSGDTVKDAADLIKSKLEKKYGEKSVTVSTSEEILNQINSILGLITLFLAGVGGISLVVGGIGITNAMITSVLERTKEIGLMKSLGASNGLILALFLLEAAFIGAIGGLLGIALGYGLSIGIATIGQAAGFELLAAINMQITLGALLFAMLIGMGAGLLPALRAANMDPVVALRYE
jgi:putative ABC transport system permease protein